jgi:predicted lipoprotein
MKMDKVKPGDVIRKTKVFSITPYSSVGTIDEFRKFTNEVCAYADKLNSGRISVDVKKDDMGRAIQIDFIVEGGKVCDEVEANFHNDMMEQDIRAQLAKDADALREIHERNPDLFKNY